MKDSFYNFYKKSDSTKLPSNLSRPHKETEMSRKHSQSERRTINLDRKSGKLNMTPFSDNLVLKNPILQKFIDSHTKRQKISELEAQSLWKTYHRSENVNNIRDTEDFNEEERYSKFLGRTKVKLEYYPRNGWYLTNYNSF